MAKVALDGASVRPTPLIHATWFNGAMTRVPLFAAVVVASLALSWCGSAAAGSSAPAPLLRQVADVPLPGPPARFDYQSLDVVRSLLYIAHMNSDTLLIFDLRAATTLDELEGFPSVHGVIAVPALDKVFATATGAHRLMVVDAGSRNVLARLGPVGYPDGLAYAPTVKRVFVSDESAQGRELVVDAVRDRVLGRIELGGEAGNTVFDPVGGSILVAVQTRREVVEIDPAAIRIVARHPLPESDRPHGLLVAPEARRLVVGDEGASRVLLVDLDSWDVLGHWEVGREPDVLAFDPGLGLVYVACEGGVLSVFRLRDGTLEPAAALHIPDAHTVAVDPATHRVYLPLANVDGKPVLRILAPQAGG